MFFVVDTVPSYNVLLGRDWIPTNGCILSTLHHMLLLWNGSKFEIVHANNKLFVTCVNHLKAQFYIGKWSTIRIAQQPLSVRIEEIKDKICEILTRPLLFEKPRRKRKISPNE
jgi:hypothetical protein